MKRHRTDAAPPGALMQLRNTRLYGTREEQVSGRALSSRGTPNQDRAYVKPRPRRVLQAERAVAAHRRHLQAAQDAMLAAQAATRSAKLAGLPYAELAAVARAARAEYVKLTGGTERREVALAESSDANKIKAA